LLYIKIMGGLFTENWAISFWTFMLVIATLVLAGVAWRQLSLLRQSNQLDTLLKLREQFFVDDLTDYYSLISNNIIDFNEVYYDFEITNTNSPLALKDKFKDNFYIITTEVMDDYLLGQFEDFGLLVKTKVVSFDLIYKFFKDYIIICGNNKGIKKYLEYEIAFDKDAYLNFRYIYHKCIEYEKKRMINKDKPEPKERDTSPHVW
jgi:hypothetical protein